MKLEHVTIDDRLRSYLKSNFANRKHTGHLAFKHV